MLIFFRLIVDFSFLRDVNDQKLHVSCMIFSQINEIVINFLIYPRIGFNNDTLQLNLIENSYVMAI